MVHSLDVNLPYTCFKSFANSPTRLEPWLNRYLRIYYLAGKVLVGDTVAGLGCRDHRSGQPFRWLQPGASSSYAIELSKTGKQKPRTGCHRSGPQRDGCALKNGTKTMDRASMWPSMHRKGPDGQNPDPVCETRRAEVVVGILKTVVFITMIWHFKEEVVGVFGLLLGEFHTAIALLAHGRIKAEPSITG